LETDFWTTAFRGLPIATGSRRPISWGLQLELSEATDAVGEGLMPSTAWFHLALPARLAEARCWT